MSDYDVAVIGGGVAGLVAAREAAVRGAQTALIQPDGGWGGLVMNVGRLDGYPAPGDIGGAALADALLGHAKAAGVAVVDGRVAGIAPGATHALDLGDRSIRAARVIVATGAALATLGVPGEAEFAFRGVSQCAWCDAGLYRGADVVVVGGGDAAFQEALHLAEYAASVTMVMRGMPRARRAYVERAADNDRIAFRWETEVLAIEGKDGVEAVRVREEGEGEHVVAASGVFVFVGVRPATAFLPPQVERDADGAVRVDARLQSAVAGLYAVGAARAGHTGSLIAAAGDGAAAAAAATADL